MTMASREPTRELPVVEQFLGDAFRLGPDLGLGGIAVVHGGRGSGLHLFRLLEELAAESTLDRVVLNLLSAKWARLHRRPVLAPNRARNLVKGLPADLGPVCHRTGQNVNSPTALLYLGGLMVNSD